MSSASFDPAAVRYVSLATYRRSGAEVRTPVWIAGRGPRHFVFSEGRAGKVKRIRANGRARLARCDVRGRIESGWIEARARVLDDPDTIAEGYRALREKYGWQMRLALLASRVSGRYRDRGVIELVFAA